MRNSHFSAIIIKERKKVRLYLTHLYCGHFQLHHLYNDDQFSLFFRELCSSKGTNNCEYQKRSQPLANYRRTFSPGRGGGGGGPLGYFLPRGGGGRAWPALGLIFARSGAAGLSKPLPRYRLFCGQLYTPSSVVTFGQICNFRDPNLVTLYLCTYLILNEELITFSPRLRTFWYVC